MKAPSLKRLILVRNFFTYQPTILTLLAIDDARNQLERGFRIVSAVAKFSFDVAIMSMGKIFVPYIPSGMRTLFGSGQPDPGLNPTDFGRRFPTHPIPMIEDPGWDIETFGSEVLDLAGHTVFQVLDPAMEFQGHCRV